MALLHHPRWKSWHPFFPTVGEYAIGLCAFAILPSQGTQCVFAKVAGMYDTVAGIVKHSKLLFYIIPSLLLISWWDPEEIGNGTKSDAE